VPQRPARIFAERFRLAVSPVPVALPDSDVSMLWHASYDHDPAHQWLRGTVARLAAELGAEADREGTGTQHSVV
jgi:DNA-binding transcriptional LysR family regulator